MTVRYSIPFSRLMGRMSFDVRFSAHMSASISSGHSGNLCDKSFNPVVQMIGRFGTHQGDKNTR